MVYTIMVGLNAQAQSFCSNLVYSLRYASLKCIACHSFRFASPKPYSSSNCANCCRKQRNEGSARTAVISRNSNITFSLPSRSLAFALSVYVCLHHSFWLCSDVAFISYFVCGRSSSSASSCHPRRQSHSIFTRIKNI